MSDHNMLMLLSLITSKKIKHIFIRLETIRWPYKNSLQSTRYLLRIDTSRTPRMQKSVSPLRHPVSWINECHFYIRHLSRINENRSQSIRVVHKEACKASRAVNARSSARKLSIALNPFLMRLLTRSKMKSGDVCTLIFFSARANLTISFKRS
jgi:hypothetical protein